MPLVDSPCAQRDHITHGLVAHDAEYCPRDPGNRVLIQKLHKLLDLMEESDLQAIVSRKAALEAAYEALARGQALGAAETGWPPPVGACGPAPRHCG